MADENRSALASFTPSQRDAVYKPIFARRDVRKR
jgi:hypothetical protein